MKGIDGQMELPLAQRPLQPTIDPAIVKAQPSMTAAINLCVNVSGLQDKVIYIDLDIDAGHWSRIRKGDAHFPVDRLNALMDLCGNEIPLQWQAMKRGYELKRPRSELETIIELEREKNRELEKKMETMIEVMKAMK